MITQTRQGLFETNSSSSHVLTVMGGSNILEEDISLSKAPGEYQIRELYDSNWDVQDNAKTFIGIEPAAFDPDEDTKMNYNYIAEKITFLWTYLIQTNIAGKCLSNFLDVVLEAFVTRDKYLKKEYNGEPDVEGDRIIVFWCKPEYLSLIKKEFGYVPYRAERANDKVPNIFYMFADLRHFRSTVYVHTKRWFKKDKEGHIFDSPIYNSYVGGLFSTLSRDSDSNMFGSTREIGHVSSPLISEPQYHQAYWGIKTEHSFISYSETDMIHNILVSKTRLRKLLYNSDVAISARHFG